MLAESLRQTIWLINKYQKESPEKYDCIEEDLDCLKHHLGLIVQYIVPANDHCVSIPKTIYEIKHVLPESENSLELS